MSFETVVALNGDYKLYYLHDKRLKSSDPYTIAELLESAENVIPATVPGNVEIDMMKEGIIPDPYIGLNLLDMEMYEYYHFVYVKEFEYPENPTGDELFRFEGVDTFASYYLNGERIASTDNMLIEHVFPAKGLRKGKNTLIVHIEPTVLRARENEYTLLNIAHKYNYDLLFVRKTASMYGWDIFPRLVSAGIWRPVSIIRRPAIRFTQVYLYTRSVSETAAHLTLFYEVELQREQADAFKVDVIGECEGHTFSAQSRVWGKCCRIDFTVDNPKLWWPKGYGEQSLYDVTVSLKQNDIVLDTERFQTGIRTVTLDRTSTVNPDGTGGKFVFIINNKPIFILGTNWVPPDAIPSLGDKRAAEILELTDDIGCNAIRIWGGGRYEKDEFYDLCDKKGILVWHDFMMACGNYPQTEEFQKAFAAEAKQIVRKLRHHPSIMLWAGDNECDPPYRRMINFTNPNDNIVTRKTLYYLLLNEDFTRPYLPSSPYFDEECYKRGIELASENHLWGPRRYYKGDFYKKAPAVFASEIGYHGCPSYESIKKFITEEALWPFDNNKEWILHASSPDPTLGEPYSYRIALMANQVKEMFGELPDNLYEFALVSQFVQAEAKKYFVERFRFKKPQRSGVIWWNICDGWPQFSDAVVDYYYTKKLAYSYIKRSQQPLCLMVDDEGDELVLVGVNDTLKDTEVEFTVKSAEDGRMITYGKGTVGTEKAIPLAKIPAPDKQDMFIIEWSSGEQKGMNTYLYGQPTFDYRKYKEWIEKHHLLEVYGF
jgi:beta-mannosidase